MASNNSDEDKTVMCLGAPLPKEIFEEIKKILRPQIGDIRWNDPRNWFINFQSFFKARPELDLKKLKNALTEKIYYPYYPILLQPRDLVLSPSNAKPRTLEWKFDILKLKDPKAKIQDQIAGLTNAMQEILKECSYSHQTMECNPSLIWARIPESMHQQPKQMKALEELVHTNMEKKQFYLEKLYMVMVTRDEFGLQYDYTVIEV
ncbi:MAG: hypothetical protein O2962_06780 [Cyanobacteria bacterium]|nr:hypothetical protein [Cyanobacteriota bacterium]